MDDLPPRPDDGHKGTFGTVVVVGGSEHMLGAPCFVAVAALRAGAGIVCLAVPEALILPALTLVPSATALPIGTNTQHWLARLEAESVLAVGCGWGRHHDHRRLLAALLAAPQRLVLDGDGLDALAAMEPAPLPRPGPLVLTPHPVEYGRLATAWGLPTAIATPEARVAAAVALARRAAAIVVLKGAGTVVTDGAVTSVDPAHDATLAIPGSGDVLTGIIAGLIAQGMEVLAAARLGVRIHGIAGGIWRERHGSRGLLAMDLAALVPDAMCSLGSAPAR